MIESPKQTMASTKEFKFESSHVYEETGGDDLKNTKYIVIDYNVEIQGKRFGKFQKNYTRNNITSIYFYEEYNDYTCKDAQDLKDAEAYNNQGNAYFNLGQFEQAIFTYDEAIRLKPQYAEAYNNRALAYKEQGERAEAIADFKKFISLTNNTDWIERVRQEIEELSN